MSKKSKRAPYRKKDDVRNEIGYNALRIAFTECRSFTVAEFCAETGIKDDSILREKLRDMVNSQKPELKAQLVFGDDGHYRMYYFANLTAPMTELFTGLAMRKEAKNEQKST